MNDDLISRQAAIDSIWDGINMDIYTSEVKESLEALPSVTPQPQTAHWIFVYDDVEDFRGGWSKRKIGYKCSHCGKLNTWYKFNYCPFCGARMEAGET